MMDAPPSRYKVVERGRQLVVIDTQTGRSAVRERQAPPTRPIEAARPTGVDDPTGNAVLITSRLYDLNGPRRIVMTPAFNDAIGRNMGGWLIAMFVLGTMVTLFAPYLWVFVLLPVLQPRLRGGLRRWITAQLDAADQAAS